MKTETFQAENMQKALNLVQKELGDEALVISVRQVPGGPLWQVWKQPNIEIVAGIPGDDDDNHVATGKHYEYETREDDDVSTFGDLLNVSEDKQIDAPRTVAGAYRQSQVNNSANKNDEKKSNENFRKNFDDLYADKKQITVNSNRNQEESKADQLKRFAAILPTLPIESTLLLQKLLKQGVSEEFVYKSTSMLQSTLTERTKNDPAKIRNFLEKQFEASINGSKTVIGVNPKIICLIGTSGVGKTSAIAKLATYYGRRHQKKVTWICADTVRAGAIAEANTYVETIGATLKIAYTPDDLYRAVDDATREGAEYVLIDTPAFNPNRETSVLEIGNLLTVVPKRNTWLVLPATAKESDLQRIYASVSHFRIRGTVVTKMDETNTFGAIFNLLVDQKLPLNFMTFGSNVVNNLIDAEPSVFVNSLFEERFAG
jgi:flagellar biosynthesis protein FlhF